MGMYGQSEIDSLRSSIEINEGEEKVHAQIMLASRLINISKDETVLLLDETIALSEDLGFSQGLVDAWVVYARFYSQRNKWIKSDSLLKLGVELSTQIDYALGKARVFLTKGGISSRKGRYPEAVANYLRGLELAESIADFDLQLTFLMNLGVIKRSLQNYDESETYLEQALRIALEHDFQFRSGQVYLNLGLLQYFKNDLTNSIEYNQKALVIFEAIGDKLETARALNNIGFAHFLQQNYSASNRYFDRSLKLKEEIGDQSGIAQILLNKAKMARVQRRMNLAISLAKTSLSRAESIDHDQRASEANFLLSQLYEEISESQRALAYFRAYVRLKDSLNTRANKAKVSQLIAEFDFERQKKELNLSQQKVKLLAQEKELLAAQQIQLILLVLLLVAIIMASVLIYKVKLRGAKANENLAKEKALNERLQNDKLLTELSLKNDQLTEYANRLSKQNTLLSDLKKRVADKGKNGEADVQSQMQRIVNAIERGSTDYLSWNEFRLKFDEIHPKFIPFLAEKHPSLTAREIDICVLLKINLSNPDIAQILNVSYDGAKKSVLRLYKKLNFDSAEQLRAHILKI